MSIPTLNSERLILRDLRPGDEAFHVSLDTDAEVMQYIHTGPLAPDEAQKWAELQVQGAMFRRNFGRWLIALRNADHTPVGWVEMAKYRGPRIDETLNDYFALGYQMSPAYWGHGYMQEACRSVLEYAFKFGLRKVLAFARSENVRSVRLIERLRFERIGECPDEAGNACDLFALLRKEWLHPGDDAALKEEMRKAWEQDWVDL